MIKKDLGLLLLIVVVGIVVAIINPRFLLPINLANTANLIGLFGILSMLQTVRIAGPWTAAEVLIAAAAVFYVSRDPLLGLATTAAGALLDVAARAVGDWRIGAAAFALGWVFQGIGHAVYEKSSPAFFRNLVHLLVGPAFLVNEAIGIRRRRAG